MDDEARLDRLSETLRIPTFTVSREKSPAEASAVSTPTTPIEGAPALSSGAQLIRDRLPPGERKIFDQRYEVYGDPIVSHRNIGRVWAATLSQHYGIELGDIPADVVALLFVQFKALRSTKALHQDNYDDLRTYATIAEGARKERHE